jgi:cytochrome c553
MRVWGAAFLLICAACQQQATPAAKPAEVTFDGAHVSDAGAMRAHGERLTHVLGCTGCHGADLQGKDMADKPEDGAMYSPNVTLIAARYGDADFERLFRQGVPKDGRKFWFMQVESYQFLSDADLTALIAYLRSLQPSGNARPAFKMNRVEQKDVDQGVLGDAKAQIAKYRAQPPVDLGPQYAWGRYMAKSTCTGCHNNALQGWPNFTPNLDIAGAYSKAELTRLLTTGQGKTGRDVGAMSGIARAYFSHLTPREREAIVDYVLARANRTSH